MHLRQLPQPLQVASGGQCYGPKTADMLLHHRQRTRADGTGRTEDGHAERFVQKLPITQKKP